MKACHFSEILRLLALSIPVGGSSAVVLPHITFVQIAHQHGLTIAQAANYNAPVFLAYSKVALGSAFVLVLLEVMIIGVIHVAIDSP